MHVTRRGWMLVLFGCGVMLLGPLLPAMADADQPAHCSFMPGRADSHAPIGVMGDHVHGRGEFMAAYRFVYSESGGLREGSSSIRPADALADYQMVPIESSMEAHNLGFMYAPLDRLTITTMIPYRRMAMRSINQLGQRTWMISEGLGDLRLAGLVPLWQQEHHRLHLNLGVSFPTGSIDEGNPTPMGFRRFGYGMQPGSGTFDLLPGATYFGYSDRWSWGAQAIGTLHLGRNDHEYRLGDSIDATGWLAYRWQNWLSTSARVAGRAMDRVQGADPSLNPLMSPGADPNARGGERVDVSAGLNLLGTGGPLRSHRLAIEVGVPVYERFRGPQLGTDWFVVAGWQWAQ